MLQVATRASLEAEVAKVFGRRKATTQELPMGRNSSMWNLWVRTQLQLNLTGSSIWKLRTKSRHYPTPSMTGSVENGFCAKT